MMKKIKEFFMSILNNGLRIIVIVGDNNSVK